MKRARAVQLAIVNWRGVFYERYELSDNVTALEGSNGAGKTTVLIAAFVALLPDMNHLRFTNVGEHAGTGGDRGIWGRLGETGRPSYTVLDIELANDERLLAGVHLERRLEPAVELTPFLITDLPKDAELQDLLLVRGDDMDAVPEIEELRQQTARFGARLHQCATAKEYFAGLFEHGVTPLRLDGDAERAKLAEMLRTSMTGGMSRVLTTGLRAFLLKEERGLADTLKRMRSNIDACRRTRGEVNEARRLEGEISSVYEAGQEMFNAGVHATKEAAREAANRTSEAEEKVRIATGVVTTAEASLESAKGDRTRIAASLAELDRKLDAERERLRRLENAQTLRQRIEKAEAELDAEQRVKGWNLDLGSTRDIDNLRRELVGQRDDTRDEAKRCEATKRECEEEHRRLTATRGSLSEEVLALSRQLGGELLASRFEEVPIEDAGIHEARLGPLANAIVVDNPASAAHKIVSTAERRPESVWLVGPGEIPDPDDGSELAKQVTGKDVIVRASEDVWRVSRIPERPVLGRLAREKKLEELEREGRNAAGQAERHRKRQTEIEAELQAITDLLSRMKTIEDDRCKLVQLGIDDVSEAAITQARTRLEDGKCERAKMDTESRCIERRLGTLTAELQQAKRSLREAQDAVQQESAIAGPANRRWEMLHDEAGELLASAVTPDVVERLEGRGSGNLFRDALNWAGKLEERLAHAEDGSEVAQTIG